MELGGFLLDLTTFKALISDFIINLNRKPLRELNISVDDLLDEEAWTLISALVSLEKLTLLQKGHSFLGKDDPRSEIDISTAKILNLRRLEYLQLDHATTKTDSDAIKSSIPGLEVMTILLISSTMSLDST